MRNSSRSVEEEGGEVLQDLEQRLLCSTEDQVRTDIHTAAHGQPHTRAGGYYLKEAAVCENLHLEQVKNVCRKEL